jgi:hypothetical protein
MDGGKCIEETESRNWQNDVWNGSKDRSEKASLRRSLS